MEQLLVGKRVLITGGASGMGRSIAQRFGAEGASAVIIADIRESSRDGETPTHETLTCESSYVQCDQADRGAVERAVEVAEEGGPLDVLVNAAAIFGPHEFTAIDDELFGRYMDVNVKGPLAFMQLVGGKMAERGSGSIINLASVSALAGTAGFALYSASKAAIQSLTYSAADLFGPDGVRVNAILPGTIDTAMTRQDVPIFGTELEAPMIAAIPLGRPGLPDDVAGAALFLASDLASFVSAQSLLVDGGQTRTLRVAVK